MKRTLRELPRLYMALEDDPETILKEILSPAEIKHAEEVFEPFDPKKDYAGAGDGFGQQAVPDSILGKRIAVFAYVHDYRYICGGDEEDREFADEEFRRNLKWFLGSQCEWKWTFLFFSINRTESMRRKALFIAEGYFQAVDMAGWIASFEYRENRLCP